MAYASNFAELVAHAQGGQLVRPNYLTPQFVEWANDLLRSGEAWDRENGTIAPIIDATMVHETYLQRDRIALYEDHEFIKPPWDNAWVCYRNDHGNLIATNVSAVEAAPTWESEHNDMSEATHTMVLVTFAGGRTGDGTLIPSHGPRALYRLATDDDGRLIDIQWTKLDGSPHDENAPEWPLITVLGAYTLLNCSNIEIVPKQLDRSERRRRDRAGIGGLVESTINIRSTVRRTAGGVAPVCGAPSSTRLHSVRGHVAHYGACCSTHEPRGLLFGRYSGRVWVPQHARGVAALGETHQTYVIKE